MVLQTAVPGEVTARRRELFEEHVARLAQRAGVSTAVVDDLRVPEWATDALPLGVAWSVTTTEPSALPNLAMVAADCLRTESHLVAEAVRTSGPSQRLVFSEIELVSGRFGRPVDLAATATLSGGPHDVTATLWQRGLTVIDVDRVPVQSRSWQWHLVAGIARVTPRARSVDLQE